MSDYWGYGYGQRHRTPLNGQTACDNPEHKGHARYVGGVMDGTVEHKIHAHPTDYPQTLGTVLRDGQRSWYEIDYVASQGSEVVYRFIGHGPEFPQALL